MKKSLVMLALLAVAGVASAQAFTDSAPCYSWNGGNFSAGSFSNCRPQVIVVPAPAPVPVAVQPAAPILMPMAAPQSTPVPVKKPVVRKRKPPVVCKP